MAQIYGDIFFFLQAADAGDDPRITFPTSQYDELARQAGNKFDLIPCYRHIFEELLC